MTRTITPSESRSAAAAIAMTFVALGAAVLLAGCGFIEAGNASSSKPSAFVLTGDASVNLPAAGSEPAGTACVSPAGTADVAEGVDVIVTDPKGTKLTTGHLGPGVVTDTSGVFACSFPFSIRGVPGGLDTYDVAIGNRPAQPFSGIALRSSTPAIITIVPGA